MKKALITGITGMDGSHLAELLLSKGYEVHGTRRPSSTVSTKRIEGLPIILHHCDLTDPVNVMHILKEVKPDEIYNLAAISHVKISFDMPAYSFDVNAVAALNILQGIRLLGIPAKFYQASTSELFGKVLETPQKETTPFYPRSPYAIAKQFAYWTVVNYREAYDIYACNGILFNHESNRRSESFVTRKISQAVARIATGKQEKLLLGNLDAKRDWGHAEDFVNAMWLMMQQDEAKDYVIATGVSTTVREFAKMAFNEVGIHVTFTGSGEQELGWWNNNVVVAIDSKYFRPAEVDSLLGDPSKAKKELGWICKHDVQSIVKEMVAYDYQIELNKKK